MNIKTNQLLSQFSITEIEMINGIFKNIVPSNSASIISVERALQVIDNEISTSQHQLVTEELESIKNKFSDMNITSVNTIISQIPYDTSCLI